MEANLCPSASRDPERHQDEPKTNSVGLHPQCKQTYCKGGAEKPSVTSVSGATAVTNSSVVKHPPIVPGTISSILWRELVGFKKQKEVHLRQNHIGKMI